MVSKIYVSCIAHTLHFWHKCITLGAIMPHLYERQKVVLYLNPQGCDLICIYLLCCLRKSNDVFLSQSSLHYSQIKVNHIPRFFSFLYLCAGSFEVKFLKSVLRRKLYPYETASRPLYFEIVIWVKWPPNANLPLFLTLASATAVRCSVWNICLLFSSPKGLVKSMFN